MFLRHLVVLLSLLVLNTGAFAKEIGDVNFPDKIEISGKTLLLNGAGYRTKWFVKVYVGGLYLTGPINDPQQIIDMDEPMGLKLHIVYDGLTGKKMTDAMDEGFLNSTNGNTDSISGKIAEFNSYFTEKINENDIFDIFYTPGQGVSVSKNGTAQGNIKGFDFKKAVFGIWLCDKPADKKLKTAILGK